MIVLHQLIVLTLVFISGDFNLLFDMKLLYLLFLVILYGLMVHCRSLE
jgi:hypothetical protein